MSKIKSLQYLLLDTLSKRENLDSEELASTIKVKENNNNYIILWEEKKIQKKIEVEKNKFLFYKRNDVEGNALDLSTSLSFNNQNANLIIDKIVKKKKVNITINFFKKYLIQILFITSILFINLSLSNIQNKLIPVLLTLFLIFDLIEKRQIFFYLFIYFISIFKPDIFILFYAFLLTIFNIMEPIYFYKKFKIFLAVSTVILNYYFLDLSLVNISYHLIFVVTLSFIITLINFTKYNSNYNWIYCLPAFSFGFLFNDEIIISYLWLGCCILLPIIFNYLDKKFFLKINTSPIFE